MHTKVSNSSSSTTSTTENNIYDKTTENVHTDNNNLGSSESGKYENMPSLLKLEVKLILILITLLNLDFIFSLDSATFSFNLSYLTGVTHGRNQWSEGVFS
jgi:hypothetical protein